AITISALYSAVNCNNINEARRQLMEGANPDTRDPYVKGWNMIHLAVHKNNPEMIDVLFKGGVNINGSPRGISPLEKAVYDKNLDCFKKLLELGADPKRAKNAVHNSGTSEMKDIFNKYKTK
ncbi:MAG: ankyrin repeat domain-containing protein, partial [Proteobacteria bacterium]|nr:ankyrin repeat domain-containing protein [Pseudomonadota bacterium]